jgi:hypothetical protein
MDRPPITFTALEWRLLASACEAVASMERERAERVGGKAARDYVVSADGYSALAKRCMELPRP